MAEYNLYDASSVPTTTATVKLGDLYGDLLASLGPGGGGRGEEPGLRPFPRPRAGKVRRGAFVWKRPGAKAYHGGVRASLRP